MKGLILILFLFPFEVISQSSFCTIEIVDVDSSDYIVEEGERLCIIDTAFLYGNIILNGGSLHNSGTIINHYIIVRGYFNEFDNYGYIKSDSISIEEYVRMSNRGHIESNVFVNSHPQSAYNWGILNTNYFINKRRSIFTNDGDFHVAFDFINTDTSEFINYSYMSIGNDFRNRSRSQFTTDCIVEIGGSWFNDASFISSFQSCAGFNVNGFTINTGWITTINAHIDICDNGNPGQIDADHFPGSITPYITYCQCENTCQQILSIDNTQTLPSLSIFPNPATNTLTINTDPIAVGLNLKNAQLQIHNAQGQLVTHPLSRGECASLSAGKGCVIDVSQLNSGIYFLSLTNGSEVVSKKFVKE
jgi:hypothetical protein